MARSWIGLTILVLASSACGSKTSAVDDDTDASDRPSPQPELCNGLDDDLDGALDEDYRDAQGRYLHQEHCGRCGLACDLSIANAVEVACALIDEVPACAAQRCQDGFTPSISGGCVPAFDHLCLDCLNDGDCGLARSARCQELGNEARCVVGCEVGCPEGYACREGSCVPEGGSCSCGPADRFSLACALTDPAGGRCVGSAACELGLLSACAVAEETCDHVDNDCNGVVDDGFRDERGAYTLDLHHCGECGVDCTLSTTPEGDLICGGDPFAPTCVLACPDTADGIQPGDRVDGDRDIATGCECTVGALQDMPGPPGTTGEDLDVNCDGADGIVVESYYVALDGDDSGPGSPSRPLATISEGLRRAGDTMDSEAPRPNVFVASGSYTESLELPDGVRLFGGYRRDFLGLDPNGFRVEVRAPADTSAPGGAALHIVDAGRRPTEARWLTLQGRDARGEGEAAFGAYVRDPGADLVLSSLEIRSGQAGAGRPGAPGDAGDGPESLAGGGDPPRAAIEGFANECVSGSENVVDGGEGGVSRCGALDVSGGRGGSPTCPSFSSVQPAGQAGRSAAGGSSAPGGAGGMDSEGPISGSSCPMAVCCGLADFSVPTMFSGPEAGRNGADGSRGAAGRGCADAFGHFDGDRWMGELATAGTDGSPGSGGGGGGAGGGTEMDYIEGACEFADGLGGGGGGGGGGGCGGRAGERGHSGAPAVALLIRAAPGAALPVVRDVLLRPGDGGRGGDGGAGGDGGPGGTGAFGGELPRAARSTPTLAGPFRGARGGQGGTGGAGGGGGGGCGGGSVGLWLTGSGGTPAAAALWREDNQFGLGRGGAPGRGGGGAVAAADGAAGGQVDVLVD